jgi:hypothetical protein
MEKFSILLLFMSMGWDCVSELRPPTGIFFIIQMIYQYGQPQWNDIDSENKKTPINTYQIATLSTTNSTWTYLGLRGERSETNPLSHGTAHPPVTYSLVYFQIFLSASRSHTPTFYYTFIVWDQILRPYKTASKINITFTFIITTHTLYNHIKNCKDDGWQGRVKKWYV